MVNNVKTEPGSAANGAGVGKWLFTVSPRNQKFIFDPATDKNIAAVEYTLNGDTVLGGTDKDIPVDDDTYSRSRASSGAAWAYTNTTGTKITAGMEVETGYVKVTTAGSNVLVDNLTGVVEDATGAFFAEADTVVNKVSNTMGSGYTVGSKFYQYGTLTFGQLAADAVDGSSGEDDQVDFVEVAQWAVTYYKADDTTDVKGFKDGANLTASEVTGEWYYLDEVTGTPAAKSNITTETVNDDTTVYGNYVKVAIDSDGSSLSGTFPTGATVRWSLTDGDHYLKVGNKVTATLNIPDANEVTAGGGGNTITPSGGASYACDVTGATTDATTKWGSNKFTLDAGKKLKGDLVFEWTLGATDATATPVLKWA